MTYVARRRLVVLIFFACVSVLALLSPRGAEAQSRRRDREKRIASDAAAEGSAVSSAAPATTSTAPAPDASKPARSKSGPTFPSAPAVPPANASRTAYSDHFALLTQKNIFLRNRPLFSRT